MANYNSNLKALKEHLQENEDVIFSVYGLYETKLLGQDTVSHGILAATSTRLILFGKRMFGFDIETINYSKISSIERGKSFFSGNKLNLISTGNNIKISHIESENYEGFLEFINHKMEDKKESLKYDIPEQIKKLSELKDQGILTEEEFITKKTELLSKI